MAKNRHLLILSLIFIVGCEEAGLEYQQNPSKGVSPSGESDHGQASRRDPETSDQQPIDPLLSKAVEIFNMVIVGYQTRDPERNVIDEFASQFGWAKLPEEFSVGGNAKVTYVAMKNDERGLLVAHQGTDEIFSIAIMRGFERAALFREIDKTLNLEKITSDFMPGQETAHYYAREKQSMQLIGILLLTTSEIEPYSRNATLSWISIDEWNRANEDW